MINLFYIILFIFFVSCQSNQTEKNILDYIILKNNVKVFQSTIDSSALYSITITQNTVQINDTTYELEFIWTRFDSLPFNKSIERCSPSSVELIEASYYALDSSKRPVEIRPEIIEKKRFTLQGPNILDMRAKFKNDSNLTMLIHMELFYKFFKIDSLGLNGKDCMELKTKNKLTMDYSDNRRDTILFSENRGIYEKGNGVIYFESNNNGRNIAYKLKR